MQTLYEISPFPPKLNDMPSIKEFYDKHSYPYEKFEAVALHDADRFPLLHAIRNRERALLDRAANKKVLYFATGSGHDISHLAEIGAQIVTMDFSMEMINRTMDRLRRKQIPFKFEPEKVDFSAESLDNTLANNKILILNKDIFELKLPKDYFDYAFCYCTLPLLEDKWQRGLSMLLDTAKNGAVSVYEVEKLTELHKYYTEFGFTSTIKDRTIHLEGGFAYYAIPPHEVIKHIERLKKLEVTTIGLGKIYQWSSGT